MEHLRLSADQRLLVDGVKAFVQAELVPHEELVERLDEIPEEIRVTIRQKSMAAGYHACNIPAAFGGGGLSAADLVLVEKELGWSNLALAECVHRPHAIICAAKGEQIDRYLKPVVEGKKRECIAMTEPDAGSDVRSMKTKAERIADGWRINGTKHFISNAGVSDFVLLFAVTGRETDSRGRISCFLVDLTHPGVSVEKGYHCVSHRGYMNNILHFTDCVVPGWSLLGEEGDGFDLINSWLGVTRLTLAATCVARAERAFDVALQWAASRKQFGQSIGRFQGVSFKLSDMATEIRLANLLLMDSAARIDEGTFSASDAAMAKLYTSEMLGRVADESIQILGGMGLMSEMPLERIWRDARIERIWDGTNEIQRHIISRSMLRDLGS